MKTLKSQHTIIDSLSTTYLYERYSSNILKEPEGHFPQKSSPHLLRTTHNTQSIRQCLQSDYVQSETSITL